VIHRGNYLPICNVLVFRMFKTTKKGADTRNLFPPLMCIFKIEIHARNFLLHLQSAVTASVAPTV
jgi:hypothetical protein